MTENTVGVSGDVPAESLHDLERDGVLERLIDEGRLPIAYFKAEVGSFERKQVREVVFCFVTPENFNEGDIVEGDASYGFEVKSPEGKVRGKCKMYEMTPEQAERIKTRAEAYYVNRK